MSPLNGVWKLVRLALRRDRFKLPVVILATVAMTAASMPALADLYSEKSAQVIYASSSSGSIAARVMGGPIDGASLGAITMVELFMFSAIIVAFIATSTMVRHTRQNDEIGRTELLESLPVGRYSQLVAALIVSCSVSIIISFLLFLVMIPTEGLSTTGTLLMATAICGVGISFAFIAAIIVQLTESARAANGLAAFAVGAAFVLRGLGDGFGKVSADGLAVVSEWPVWLSPLGWGQQTHPFTQENWINLSYFFIFSFVAGIVGLLLLKKRDVGLAIFTTRPGPDQAAKSLRSNLALSWRLQKTVLIGWLSFFILFGGMIGAMANEFEDIIQELYQESDFASTFFAQTGDASFQEIFFASMYFIFSVVAAAYAVHALTKLRAEESSGHLEMLLSAKADRIRWVFSHVVWILLGLTLMFFATAITSSIVNAIVTDQSLTDFGGNVWSMFSLMPATLVIAAFVLLVYGFIPKLTTALSWTAFAGVFFIMQFSDLIKIPQYIQNFSPFSHLPLIPVDSFEPLPFFVLIGTGLLFYIIGLYGFTRRDIGIV